jgi:hypothetical protein
MHRQTIKENISFYLHMLNSKAQNNKYFIQYEYDLFKNLCEFFHITENDSQYDLNSLIYHFNQQH